MLNIVTNRQVLMEFAKSKHYKVNLGMINTIESNGARSLNNKDIFAFSYNSRYNATIQSHGNIGDIRFYTDNYINDQTIAVYSLDFEEFIYTFDNKLVREKGIDFYIGHILKKTEEEYDERKTNNQLKQEEVVQKGDSDKIFTNPGNVRYDDIKAYIEQKNRNRI